MQAIVVQPKKLDILFFIIKMILGQAKNTIVGLQLRAEVDKIKKN